MFDSPAARLVLRSALTGVASLCSVYLASLPLDTLDLQKGILAGVLSALSFAGIGVASKTLEPAVGRTDG